MKPMQTFDLRGDSGVARRGLVGFLKNERKAAIQPGESGTLGLLRR